MRALSINYERKGPHRHPISRNLGVGQSNWFVIRLSEPEYKSIKERKISRLRPLLPPASDRCRTARFWRFSRWATCSATPRGATTRSPSRPCTWGRSPTATSTWGEETTPSEFQLKYSLPLLASLTMQCKALVCRLQVTLVVRQYQWWL